MKTAKNCLQKAENQNKKLRTQIKHYHEILKNVTDVITSYQVLFEIGFTPKELKEDFGMDPVETEFEYDLFTGAIEPEEPLIECDYCCPQYRHTYDCCDDFDEEYIDPTPDEVICESLDYIYEGTGMNNGL